MKNIIYIHVCCINNWETVFNGLMESIRVSGLYDIVEEIRCVVLGKIIESPFKDPKIKIIYNTNDMKIYEFKIMELIYHDSLRDDFNFLYIHTKGITHFMKPDEECVMYWVKLLVYYTIFQHKKCIELLDTNSAVGVNLQKEPVLHFSGNFWWSKSDHIKTLGLIKDKSYNGPEFYVTSKPGKYISLWNSGVNHYHIKYVEENYVGKIQLIQINRD